VRERCSGIGAILLTEDYPILSRSVQVLKLAANSKADNGISADEAKMEVHAEDDGNSEKQPETKNEANKAGAKREHDKDKETREQNADPTQQRHGDGHKRMKTGQSAHASAPGIPEGAGVGSPKKSPLLSAQPAHAKSASFSLHDAVCV
jgi:hypothetical protein